MKMVIKTIIAVSMLSSLAMAEDTAITGCKDWMKDRYTFEAGIVGGTIMAVSSLGQDVLVGMELKTFQGLDSKDVIKLCKRLLSEAPELQKDYPNMSLVLALNGMARGELARANGHEWDDVQERKKYMRTKSGFEDISSRNKKY